MGRAPSSFAGGFYIQGEEQIMSRERNCIHIGLTAAMLAASFLPATLHAQEEAKRKVKTQVEAVYPELARKYSLAGKVRISVVVGKDGRVKSSKVLGGNAVLANSAQDALKEWRFAPGPDDTTEVIEFEFKAKS
jgi:TonB family protein